MTTSQTTVILTRLDHGVPIPKKDGGTYLGTVIGYNARDGQARTKNIHGGILAQNVELTADLKAVKVGDLVTIAAQKVGNFMNIVSVKKADPAVAPPVEAKPAFVKGKSFVDNSIGMQVGNALNNATALLAAMDLTGLPTEAVLKDLELLSEDILAMGERLKAKLVGGLISIDVPEVLPEAKKATPTKAKAAVPVAPAAVAEEDDIEF